MTVGYNTEVGGVTFSYANISGSLALSGNLYVSGTLTGSNFNADGVRVAQYNQGTGIKPKGYYFFDDFDGYANNAIYYPSQAGSGATITTAAAILFANGTIVPAAYGFGALVCKTGVGNGYGNVGGITYCYNALLGRFSKFRSRFGFWLDTLSTSSIGADSFSASIGMGYVSNGAIGSARNTALVTYCDSLNGGKWQLTTFVGATKTDTGIPVVANDYYILDFSVNVTAPNTVNNTGSWTLTDATAGIAASGTMYVPAATYFGNAHESGIALAFISKMTGSNNRNFYVDFWEFDGVY